MSEVMRRQARRTTDAEAQAASRALVQRCIETCGKLANGDWITEGGKYEEADQALLRHTG